jgi:hypothetical protein
MREVHIVEPWHNLNKNEQIIGRGTRSFGHSDLPENQKNITIYFHTSVVPPKHRDTISKLFKDDDDKIERFMSVDMAAYKRGYIKKLNELKILDILIENAIDCNMHIELNEGAPRIVNQVDSQGIPRNYKHANTCALFNVTSESYCDKELSIVCKPNLRELTQKDISTQLNKSTYNYFSKDNIKIDDAKYFIRELFKVYYILSLGEIQNFYSNYLKSYGFSYDEHILYIAIDQLSNDNITFANKAGTMGYIRNKYDLENLKDSVYVFESANNEYLPVVYRHYDLIDYIVDEDEDDISDGSGDEVDPDVEDIETKVESPASKKQQQQTEPTGKEKKDKGRNKGVKGQKRPAGKGKAKDESKKANKGKKAKPKKEFKILPALFTPSASGTSANDGLAKNIRDKILSALLNQINRTVIINYKVTSRKHTIQSAFSKDKFPNDPSVLSIGAYDGQIIDSTATTQSDINDKYVRGGIKKRAFTHKLVHKLKIDDDEYPIARVKDEDDNTLTIEATNLKSKTAAPIEEVEIDKKTALFDDTYGQEENLRNIDRKLFADLEELLKIYSINNLRSASENSPGVQEQLDYYKRSIYISYLGAFLLECLRLNTGKNDITDLTIDELRQECENIRGQFTSQFNRKDSIYINIDKYVRYYILDRLQIYEKKILLDYILSEFLLDDNGNMKPFNKVTFTSEHLRNGINHIIDFFLQNFSLTYTPIYIIKYEGNVYYRLYETSFSKKTDYVCNIVYYNAKTGLRIDASTESKIDKDPRFFITHKEVGINHLKFCNFFGYIKAHHTMEKAIRKDFTIDGQQIPIETYIGPVKADYNLYISDMNFDVNKGKDTYKNIPITKRREGNITTGGNNKAGYRGSIGSTLVNLYNNIIDMYQHLFNLPSENNAGIRNRIDKGDAKTDSRIIISDSELPIYIRNPKRPMEKSMSFYEIKFETILRLLKDIVLSYHIDGNTRMPFYWFIGSDEINARYLPRRFNSYKGSNIYNSKAWTHSQDYVHVMCDQLHNILELYGRGELKCELCDAKDDLYFNEEHIVCGKHKKNKVGPAKMAKKPKTEVIEYIEPTINDYFPMPAEITPKMLLKVFNYMNSNLNACIFSTLMTAYFNN